MRVTADTDSDGSIKYRVGADIYSARMEVIARECIIPL